ncbi:MAG: hypothetical protein SGBAC_009450 [Bacillariaceae sp.]
MKANSLKGILKSARMEMREMGDKKKQRLKAYIKTKGNLFFPRSSTQRCLTQQAEVGKEESITDENNNNNRFLRTTVIVEQSPEPVEVVDEDVVGDILKPKSKRKRGILNKFVSKMMDTRGPPPPPPPVPGEDEGLVSEMNVSSLRNKSPLIDRKRSDGTVDTSKNGETASLEGEEENDDDATEMMVMHRHPSETRDVRSSADTVDASTVVVSNRSNTVTRMLCNMSEEATVRDINAWRNAACDLLLL